MSDFFPTILFSNPRLKRIYLLFFILPILHLSTALNAGGYRPKPGSRILVIHSCHEGLSWTDNITDGIKEAFKPYAADVEICFEFMDASRLHSNLYFNKLHNLYKIKYADRRIDLIICSGDYALNFMTNIGKAVFSGVPVVFCGVSDYKDEIHKGNIFTGLMETADIKATLDIAVKLHPDPQRVLVITDNTRRGITLKKKSLDILINYSKKLIFEFVDISPVNILYEKISGLGSNDIVLLLSFAGEKEGRMLSYEYNMVQMAGKCRAPVYSVWDFYLGYGILGGKMVIGKEDGRMAADTALRILAGEKASGIPVSAGTAKYMFDYNQLKRFDISVSDLPDDSEIINRPFSFLKNYRLLMWFLLTAFTALICMVVFLFMNIARRKKAEKALRDNQERLQLVLDGSELGMWDWNIKTGEVIFNERWAEMLGYELHEIEPHFKSWESRIHPDDLPGVKQFLNDHLKGLIPSYETEHRLQTKKGKWIWVHDRGKVVEWDSDGAPVRATGTHLDITDRKLTEIERRRLEARVQHSQKLESLGVLAGGIAHDFNNLLAGIMGNASMALMEVEPGSSVSHNLSEIEKASKRAAELCRQMLAYSGKGNFIIEKINLSEVVREMANLLDISISKKAAIYYNFDDGNHFIEADGTQIRQIIMNLITNASEALGEKNGIVSVTTGYINCDRHYLKESIPSENLPEGGYVFVEVTDNGMGMDEGTKHRIFDPFFSTKFAGRGLGLSAVIGIVRSHRGGIKIYSEPGKGTTFRVFFPVLDNENSGFADNKKNSGQKYKPSKKNRKIGSGTVLVVDDDLIVRNVARSMLERMGFSVVGASDGEKAVEIFSREKDQILCVLLDLTMPGIDGKECFGELKRIKPDVKVILSSGYNEQDATKPFIGKGLLGFIQKPYIYNTLEMLLKKAMEN